MKVVTKTE